MARGKEFDEEKVLEKAMNIFWLKGYNGTSAQDLVDNLGISRSSLYDTFGDKRTLFVRALTQYSDKMGGAAISMIKDNDDAEKAIRKLFESLINESILDETARGCFIVNSAIELSSHDKEIHDIVQANMVAVENAFVLAIKKGQAAGQFSTKNEARVLARFLFNNIAGLRVAARAGREKKVFDDILKVLLSTLK